MSSERIGLVNAPVIARLSQPKAEAKSRTEEGSKYFPASENQPAITSAAHEQTPLLFKTGSTSTPTNNQAASQNVAREMKRPTTVMPHMRGSALFSPTPKLALPKPTQVATTRKPQSFPLQQNRLRDIPGKVVRSTKEAVIGGALLAVGVAFLASNPVGWGIAIAVGAAFAAYSFCKFVNSVYHHTRSDSEKKNSFYWHLQDSKNEIPNNQNYKPTHYQMTKNMGYLTAIYVHLILFKKNTGNMVGQATLFEKASAHVFGRVNFLLLKSRIQKANQKTQAENKKVFEQIKANNKPHSVSLELSTLASRPTSPNSHTAVGG